MAKKSKVPMGSKGLPKGKTPLPKGLRGKGLPKGGGASGVASTTKNGKYGRGC